MGEHPARVLDAVRLIDAGGVAERAQSLCGRLHDGVVRRTGRARREERVKAGGTQRLERLEERCRQVG